jgi:site-specific DNA-methyltransferase (adenine-specific)
VRVERIGECQLILGDCREVSLPGNAAIVADPPYGIAYVKGDGGRRVAGTNLPARRHSAAIVGDDTAFDPSPWVSFPETILWGADHYAARLPHGRWLAWDKLAGATLQDSFSDVEFAWHSKRGAARIINYLWKGVLQDGEKGVRRWHPTQKPVAVMEWCIKQLHGYAETICDPYMGSGSTGVAAARLGRKFVGVEIDPGHFETACRRIEAAYAQPDLFVKSPEPKPEQLSLLGAAE